MNDSNQSKDEIDVTAGYCGLACKACSVYIASQLGKEALEQRAQRAGVEPEAMRCNGCRSEKTSPYCTSCEMKRCIRERKLSWCSECSEYPCERITAFQASMPHRAEIMKSLDFAKTHTMEEWNLAVEKNFTCPNCGVYNSIYEKQCRNCGQAPVSLFAQRHRDLILERQNRT